MGWRRIVTSSGVPSGTRASPMSPCRGAPGGLPSSPRRPCGARAGSFTPPSSGAAPTGPGPASGRAGSSSSVSWVSPHCFVRLSEWKVRGTDSSGWYLPEVKEARAAGRMAYAGKYSAPDYELLQARGCGMALESTMIYHNPEGVVQLQVPAPVRLVPGGHGPLRIGGTGPLGGLFGGGRAGLRPGRGAGGQGQGQHQGGQEVVTPPSSGAAPTLTT